MNAILCNTCSLKKFQYLIDLWSTIQNFVFQVKLIWFETQNKVLNLDWHQEIIFIAFWKYLFTWHTQNIIWEIVKYLEYVSFLSCANIRFSLIYNTSATQVPHEWHKCNTSATRTTRVRHKRKNNYASNNIFPHLYIYYSIWQVKDYKERNNFILRTTFWKCLVPMPKCVWKAPRKLNFLMANGISKSYTLECSCTIMPLHVPSRLRIVTQPHFR